MKLLKGNLGEKLDEFGFVNDFLNIIQKAQSSPRWCGSVD